MPKNQQPKKKPEAVPPDPDRPLTAQQTADRLGASLSLVCKLWRFLPETVAAFMRAGSPSPVPTPDA